MHRLRIAAMIVAAASQLMFGCAGRATGPASGPEATARIVTAPPPKVAPTLSNGWPAGTPELREVILDFTLSGRSEKILSDKGVGYLVIQSRETGEVARLMFHDGEPSRYHLPAHSFKVLRIGAQYFCKETGFSLAGTTGGPSDPSGVEKSIESKNNDLAQSNQYDVYFFTNINAQASEVLITFKSEYARYYGYCLTEEEWLKREHLANRKPQNGGDESTGGKIAKCVARGIVLIPLGVLLGGPVGPQTCQ